MKKEIVASTFVRSESALFLVASHVQVTVMVLALKSSERNVHDVFITFRELRGVTLIPLVLELDIYSLAHHLCKMWIFYEPRRITLGNTRHFVEE